MRNQIYGIIKKYMGKTPREVGCDNLGHMANVITDDLMMLGIENLRDELPSKVPLEGIIQYQDAVIKKLEQRIEGCAFIENKQQQQIEELQNEIASFYKMSSKEKIVVKGTHFYSNLKSSIKKLEASNAKLKQENSHYFRELIKLKKNI